MITRPLGCLMLLAGFIGFSQPCQHLPAGAEVPLAEKYPGDNGIEQDPDVLYVEKFDDGMASVLSRYTDILNADGMSLDSVDVPARGNVSLKMANQGGQNDGGHLFRRFDPGFDGTIYIRYYVKYPASSNGYIHHESVWIGGYNPSIAFPSPKAGICGLGDKRISIAYEPVNGSKMDTYIYWGDMRAGARGRCYGNDLINGSSQSKPLEWDTWMCVELMIKLNHPITAYNGELKVWQDGVVVGHWGPGFPKGSWQIDSWLNHADGQPFEGFQWRTDEKLNINHVWIEFYDDTTPEGDSHHIKFSNMVIARKYIGPIIDNPGNLVGLDSSTMDRYADKEHSKGL